MKYQIRYQTLKLADIVHPPYNPRVQIERDTPEYDALKRSLEQHELVEPLVVNLCNMHCVGGNQRLTVMRDMGVEEETCVVIEQPDELKEKELCLALNKIKGRWDTEKTGELLRDDAVLDFETGFDLDEVKSYRAIEEAAATDGDGLDELEDDTEEPETCCTYAKIGHIKVKLMSFEYDELLNGIRDNGIFSEMEIKAEMKRRILKND